MHLWDGMISPRWVTAHAVKVASLAAARTTWPATDAQSQELPGAWPAPRLQPVAAGADEDAGARVAGNACGRGVPLSFIFEKTIEEFKRPEVPDFRLADRQRGPGRRGVQFGPGLNPSTFTPPLENRNPPGVAPTPGDPNAPAAPVVKELVFDVLAKPLSGNLGLYLKDQLKPGDTRVQVRVSGTGKFYFTPVKVPDGISLEIVVETARQAGGVPPEWITPKTAVGEARSMSKGATCADGCRDRARRGARLKALIRAEDAHLVLNHCRLRTDPRLGPAQKNGGNLIVFRAPTTRPLADHPWPFDKPFDKPVCRILDSALITSGDMLTADLGRGLIVLTQCAVAAGNAFVLAAFKVARSRFECDLVLER